METKSEIESGLEAKLAAICGTCLGLGGRMSRYGPPLITLLDGRLSGWTVGGKKDCEGCGGTGFATHNEPVET